MKLELLLAAVLLAAGCLLWGGQIIGRENIAVQPSDSTLVSTGFGPASEQGRAAPKKDQTTLSPNLQSIQLLRNASENLVNSVGIDSEARVTTHLFNTVTVANGKYYQMGQGTSQSRLELSSGKGVDAFKIVQLCDGRLYYTLTSTQKENILEFVDLERVATASGSNQPAGVDSTTLLSTGGITCLLRNLATLFEFDTPQPSQLGGVAMLTISGTWKIDHLRRLTAGLVDPKNLQTNIDWDRLPPQLPHAVTITLGNDDFLPLFPYRIDFYQYDSARDSFTKPMLTLELFEVSKSAQLPPELFEINSTKAILVDSTERYVVRVKEFRRNSRAVRQHTANTSESTTR